MAGLVFGSPDPGQTPAATRVYAIPDAGIVLEPSDAGEKLAAATWLFEPAPCYIPTPPLAPIVARAELERGPMSSPEGF